MNVEFPQKNILELTGAAVQIMVNEFQELEMKICFRNAETLRPSDERICTQCSWTTSQWCVLQTAAPLGFAVP